MNRRRARSTAAAAAIAALLAGGMLTGCSAAADDRPLVVVTTNILGDVVGEIAGEDVQVLTLMPPDADPHSFEISAQEASKILSADLLVSNGLGLEEGLQQHIDAAAAENVPIIAAGDLVTPLEYGSGDAEGFVDPHLWTDPTRMIDVVDGISAALSETIPEHAASVTVNAAAYADELRALDAELQTGFATIPSERRSLVTNHHVFGYLADRYGFTVIGAIVPGGSTLAAPSASDLDELATAIRDAGVPTIFADSSQPDRLARVLADEAGVDVDVVPLFTESLTASDGDAPTYLRMMRENADRIVSGLT